MGLVEFKPELCLGGAEPLFEAAWYYIAFTRDQLQTNLGFHLPCFVLYAAGKSPCLFQHVCHALKFANLSAEYSR